MYIQGLSCRLPDDYDWQCVSEFTLINLKTDELTITVDFLNRNRLFFAVSLINPAECIPLSMAAGATDDPGERGRDGGDGVERHDGLGRGLRHRRIHGPEQLLLPRLRQGMCYRKRFLAT